MWWTVFGAIDLYIGLIILDTLKGTAPPEKQKRLAIARKITIVMLVLTGAILAVQVVRRY